jgi:hypothetical protein
MLDQLNTNRLQQVATLVNSGQRGAAAGLCRQVLAAHPDDISALLWLAYTSPNQIESEEMIAKAYDLQPQDPNVLQAVNWYNTHFVDQPAQPEVAGTAPSASNAASLDQRHTPVGAPVRDATNFIMSQSGGMVIGSGGVLVTSLATFSYYTFFRGVHWTPFGLPRLFYVIGALGLAVVALGFLIFAIKDVVTPPIKAYGFIKNRKEIRREINDRALGRTTEFHYEVQFYPDDGGDIPVKLTLTKEQFEVSSSTNRAYVEYTKSLGQVKIYQPLRSIH